MTAIGLMSGTSLDGVDVAAVTTDGRRIHALGPVATYPYDTRFQTRLRQLLGREPDGAAAPVIRELTEIHAEAVKRLLSVAGMSASRVDVVGFPGQTVVHRPELRITRQMADGQLLADTLGIPVVVDFRSADVAAGGHGAPLASLFHAALARSLEKPLAVLNVGGVANITWIGADDAENAPSLIAFDTGPGNALIDDWVRAVTGRQWDERGRLARGGKVRDELLAAWLRDPYFRAAPPKSLDRNTYAEILDSVRGLSPEDGAATLTAFTARAAAAAQTFMPAPPKRWLVCGGGRRNSTLMAMLANVVGAPVDRVEAVSWDGDMLEAQAFGFLAVRSVRNLPLSLPSTTGVPLPQCGGILHQPS